MPKGIYEKSPEHRAKIAAILTGRKLSEETKQKMSIAQTGRTHTEETRKRMSDVRYERNIPGHFGAANPRWKGGRWECKSSGGYVFIKSPGHPHANRHGYVREHIFVMCNHLGRPLASNEIVHHKDEDKTNNSLDNLELMTRAEHCKHHKLALLAGRGL